MSSKRAQSIADRKNRILDAARTIIARDGYDALTTRGIAEAAGVTAPTLYNLIGDKLAIVSAMATASIDELWERLHLDERNSPIEMADAILDEAFAQILAEPEVNCATFIALERMGIAFSYHPTREDAGAHTARRSIEMAQYACDAAQSVGQLRGNLSSHELALQMFATYRAPLDDWVHQAIDANEMLRRQRIGFYTVLASDASEEFREELLRRIAALSSPEVEWPDTGKEAA
ncbi:TetR/AcrR family transcriptional regulator [uncultured Erythrobacter sp.]|uniref:TetR/AcrR family transcriptional regulator n=1 Tax=uncultured Erythrobacter sp. TaxID=263913 RepID=UPI00260A7B69|nr:TetR/AcrR family transcriptional regulator [uncultured Erythrobacter sp.]